MSRGATLRSGGEAALTGAQVRWLVAALVARILAATLGGIGAIFAAIGLLDDEVGATFLPLALTALAAGAAALGAGAVASARARRAAARERAARSARGRARVLAVRLHAGTRIGSLVTATLTVRLPAADGGGREASRRLHLTPLLRVVLGGELLVAYDPADPRDFVPLLP